MAKASSQKFIARNRAPRVQIEYDVELYGAEKKVQLPFVMGVMTNLSGNPSEALPAVADRVGGFDVRAPLRHAHGFLHGDGNRARGLLDGPFPPEADGGLSRPRIDRLA